MKYAMNSVFQDTVRSGQVTEYLLLINKKLILSLFGSTILEISYIQIW